MRLVDAPEGELPSDLTNVRNVTAPPEHGPCACSCCGWLTLMERGAYDICPVCFWEDDGQDEHDADEVRGGPNGALSLTEARGNYLAFGAVDECGLEHVRAPLPEEHPNPG